MIADDATLARLMVNAQKGDRQSYAVLLHEANGWLRRYFARRVAPPFLDDLVQETLISLHRKLASYDPGRPFIPWLAAIARYRWVDQLRRIYRAAEESPVEEVAAPSDEDALSARLSLDRLFAHLPERQARVIRMVRIDGCSIAEAAAATGQSESLVKVNIHRGLRKLTVLVERE